MINLEKLKTIKTIITHDNCPDGLASALILHNCLTNAEIIFCQHNAPQFLKLKASANMLFVDISPPKNRIQEFIDAGAIVLDHHKTTEPIVRAFGENGIFADEKENGICGAVLAFEHVWKQIILEKYYLSYNDQLHSMKLFAELVGIRDTWQSKNLLWIEACQQAEVLKFWPKKYWFDIEMFSAKWFDMFKFGPVLWDKVQEKVKNNISHAYKFTTSMGTRVIMFEDKFLTSDTAEIVGEDADLIVGFHYDFDGEKQNLQFLLRSHTNFDCAKFAIYHNSGGYTKAASCMIYLTEKSKQPYECFQELIEKYEAKNANTNKQSSIITHEMKEQFVRKLNSEETRQKLRELDSSSRKMREDLRKCMQVNPELMCKRITI